jgi:hypothetical protein
MKTIDVSVPDGTQIYCRGSLAANLASLSPGDRIQACTNFIGQGQRQASWVVINGMAGWSDVAGVTDSSLVLQPSANYGATNGVVALTITGETRFSAPDGLTYLGDKITWTGTADGPGSNPDTIWGIAVNYLTQSGS